MLHIQITQIHSIRTHRRVAETWFMYQMLHECTSVSSTETSHDERKWNLGEGRDVHIRAHIVNTYAHMQTQSDWKALVEISCEIALLCYPILILFNRWDFCSFHTVSADLLLASCSTFCHRCLSCPPSKNTSFVNLSKMCERTVLSFSDQTRYMS